MTPAALTDQAHDLLAHATAIAREIARAHLASPTQEYARALCHATRITAMADDLKRALLDAVAKMESANG